MFTHSFKTKPIAMHTIDEGVLGLRKRKLLVLVQDPNFIPTYDKLALAILELEVINQHFIPKVFIKKEYHTIAASKVQTPVLWKNFFNQIH